MEHVKVVIAAFIICGFENAGGIANGNMFGNFARWNEPSREESNKKIHYDYNLHVSPTLSSSSVEVAHSLASKKMMLSGGSVSSTRLHIQVYRTLSDAVVLDWTISLADKDRMKTCAVTYLAKEANESTTIDPFMPRTRTFLLEHLLTGQQYQFNMSCLNAAGDTLQSDLLEFATLEPKLYSEWTSSDYLKEMNPALPAISNSVVHKSQDSITLSTLSRTRQKTSPHAVLGVACAIFGVVVIIITVGIALRRYSLHKRTQTRLWELQTVPEVEAPVMPTFINLPPPYSEQPSPLYNLCSSFSTTASCYSSANSSSVGNYCEHYSRLNLSQGCCYHQHICANIHQTHHQPEESTTEENNDNGDIKESGDKIMEDEVSVKT